MSTARLSTIHDEPHMTRDWGDDRNVVCLVPAAAAPVQGLLSLAIIQRFLASSPTLSISVPHAP